MKLESLIGNSDIRYFSYGRHALAQALRSIGVGSGDRVLLPEFICRDLLSSINSIGALPVYYAVDKKLALAAEINRLPSARAVIAVNYFGFPQNLTPFEEYCGKNGAILIEDNAHGLFSRDEKGYLLGTRGDIGIFSLRKTVFMPDGAALAMNNSKMNFNLGPQLDHSDAPSPLSFRMKKALKTLAPYTGVWPLKLSTMIVRYARKIRFGQEMPRFLHDAEFVLPGLPNPCRDMFSYLLPVDVDREAKRRRELYAKISNLLENAESKPVFDRLPQNAVPYGYPFYASDYEMPVIKRLLMENGFECFKWPDLPDIIKPYAQEHYKTVWFVNFL